MKRPEKHLQFIVNEIFKRHVGAVRTKTRGMGEDYRTALTDETIDVCEGVWGVFGGRARLTKAIGNCIGDSFKCRQEVLRVCVRHVCLITSKNEISTFSHIYHH